MNPERTSILEQLARWDEQRPSLPGEHWLSFGLGLYLVLRHSDTPVARLASAAAGTFFIARALSGRDGALAVLSRYARSGGDDGFVEVAAPWPYHQRIRISRPRPTRPQAVRGEGTSRFPEAVATGQ